MDLDETRQHDHTGRSRSHLAVALVITISFFVVELVGAYITNSLALAADAWHMLNDSVALAFALVAVIGLAANGLSAGVLSRSKSDSLNVKGAFLHVVSDTLSSVAVIVAGLIMFFTGWYQADPIFSMLVAIRSEEYT